MADQPAIIPGVWAEDNTTVNEIPATTTEFGKASWEQGFPVETSLPLSQGGIPPKYGDFNGVLKILSEFAVYAQAGGRYAWSDQLDYSAGSVVLCTDGYLYKANLASGPSTAAVNPVGDTTGTWDKIVSIAATNQFPLVFWNPNGNAYNGAGNGNINCFISDGISTQQTLEDGRDHDVPHLKDVIAIGNRALYGATKTDAYCPDMIALGCGVMSDGDMSAGKAMHDIGIGQFSLHNLTTGHRNIALGSLAMLGARDVRRSIAIGRDSAQCLAHGLDNLAVGYQAMAGIGHSTLDGHFDGWYEQNFNGITSIGAYANAAMGCSSKLHNLTTLGAQAGRYLQRCMYSVFLGDRAAQTLDRELSYNGNATLIPSKNGTYSVSSGIVTVTCVGHHAQADKNVTIQFTSGGMFEVFAGDEEMMVQSVSGDTFTIQLDDADAQAVGTTTGDCIVFEPDYGTYTVSGTVITVTMSAQHACVGYYVIIAFTTGTLGENYKDTKLLYVKTVSGNTFTLEAPTSFNGSGDCYVTKYETNDAVSKVDAYNNVVVGSCAARRVSEMRFSTIVGGQCAENVAGSILSSTLIGDRVSRFAGTINMAVAIGAISGPTTTGGTSDNYCNICVGYEAGKAMNGTATNVQCNTAVGHRAMKYMQDGTTGSASALKNATALGYDARVSGSNQVQLGNSDTTTYAYGSVQDRSDARDKADVRDTVLGLDFINELRPVDFRWDMRDDYFDVEEYEETVADEKGDEITETRSRLIPIPKDGSKKRTRYHHGLIAQEVKAVMDEMGVDFGGYQDHKINGGKDVLTIGYAELVAPLIKAVQQLSAKVERLEARIAELEA